MISSTSPSDRTPHAGSVPPGGHPTARPHSPQPDQISIEQAAFLKVALERQPEIRSEVVARGRALAADPSYPPPEVLQRISEMILAAPDLSEDES